MSLNTSILQIGQIIKIFPLLSDLSSSALVLWDFNNTLLMHKDRIIRHQESKNPIFNIPKDEFLAEALIKGKDGREILSKAYEKEGAFRIIEPEIQELLNILSSRKIPTTVLTSCKVGQCGAVNALHEVLLHHLEAQNMSFKSFFPHCSELEIYIPEGPPALLKNGVIFNNNNSKGKVLQNILSILEEKEGWRPSEILFIDDLLPHLKEVEAVAHTLKIPFRGFHYTYVEDHLDSSNQSSLKKQLHTILERNEWVFEDQ